jgi:hypothetical protein
MKLPKYFWFGFIVMLVAYTLIRMFFYDGVLPAPHWVKEKRQLVRWGNITLIYVIGILIVRKMGESWMLWAWNAVHLIVMFYLLFLAAYEYLVGDLHYGLRASVAPIIEFLISPAYFVALGVLYAYAQRKSDNS